MKKINANASKLLRKILVLPDLHIPNEDPNAVNAVLAYANDHKPWDELILLGDLMDMNCISSHNAGNLRAIEAQNLMDDYDKGNTFLDRLEGLARKTVYLQGNHEYRVERYINANPQLKGSIEPEKQLHLAQRGIKWIKSWEKGEMYKVGKAVFVHGLYHNEFHAKSMVLAFESNIFYGHLHDIMSYPKVNKGEHNTKTAQSLGCLCRYNQTYILGKPTKWQQAFGIFYFLPNGNFNYYIPMIFNGCFVAPDGKIYGRRKETR